MERVVEPAAIALCTQCIAHKCQTKWLDTFSIAVVFLPAHQVWWHAGAGRVRWMNSEPDKPSDLFAEPLIFSALYDPQDQELQVLLADRATAGIQFEDDVMRYMDAASDLCLPDLSSQHIS